MKIGVSYVTIYAWTKKHKEFLNAFTQAQEFPEQSEFLEAFTWVKELQKDFLIQFLEFLESLKKGKKELLTNRRSNYRSFCSP